MNHKFLEIRDRATFIPALAIHIRSGDSWLMRRAGFGGSSGDESQIFLTYLNGGQCNYDPYQWSGCGRTMRVAHEFIIKHWDNIHNGDLICVETILGERNVPVISEKFLTERMI